MKIVFFLFVIFTYGLSFSYGQDSDFVIIANHNVLDTIHLENEDYIDDIIYLGVINNDQGEIAYHIISEETYVRGSGHSFLVLFYLDLNYHVVKRWELGAYSDIPFQICENKLYFKYVLNDTTEIYINDVGSTPPKYLCVKPDDCY